MSNSFKNITIDNIDDEHICCIIRSKKEHLGVSAKKSWLKERLKEGHVFRKLDVKGTVFIEYAPLEKAWVPIIGDDYYYLYCLWVTGEYKGQGYAKELLEYCIADARKNGKSGICMLASKKQKAWLSDQSFAKKYGFQIVDSTDYGYDLLALSFDGTNPMFTCKARKGQIESKELTIYYDRQCPYIYQNIEMIRDYCKKNAIILKLIEVDTLTKAKELPSVFNNFGVFYNGKFITVNLLDVSSLTRILKNKISR